jgi:hypothetical protein
MTPGIGAHVSQCAPAAALALLGGARMAPHLRP